ncbi:MAG: tetraacyldisaccharide 4'-kinase, partial [Candidatus Omnitrophica bacterium]|nr:tetraacyldisaccharide 4'-kinase [Candidatus Omnitrophota bacterium]
GCFKHFKRENMKEFLYHFIQEEPKNFLAQILLAVLWVLSAGYFIFSRLIFLGYQLKILRTKSLPRPVISIGNLTFGGTGKTPLTVFVADYLKKKGCEPVVLIRGYMASKGSSDEVALYKEILPQVPVAQGKNRFEAGLKALAQHPKTNVFVLDDGFQHWPLNRNLDIVVIDATDPFGNGFLIPRGGLREPISALKRADIIIIAKVDLGKENLPRVYEAARKNNFHAIFGEAIYAPVKLIDLIDLGADKDISYLLNRGVALCSAIGNPKAFQKSVEALGACVQKTFSFLDHHIYTRGDVEGMIHHGRIHNIKTFVVTQKDAVKLKSFADLFPQGFDLLALAVELKITQGEEEIGQRINSALRR